MAGRAFTQSLNGSPTQADVYQVHDGVIDSIIPYAGSTPASSLPGAGNMDRSIDESLQEATWRLR